MSKLNLKVIDKLIENKCSSTEINLLLYLSSISSEFGIVRNIYYKNICTHIQITHQSFYNALFSLQDKELIAVDNTNTWGTWNVMIIDNIYLKESNKKVAYLNTSRFSEILFSKEFKKSPINIKYLILNLLKVKRENESFKISINKLLDYACVKSTYVLHTYIDFIKQWFDIALDGQFYNIKVKPQFSHSNDSIYEFNNKNNDNSLNNANKELINILQGQLKIKDMQIQELHHRLAAEQELEKNRQVLELKQHPIDIKASENKTLVFKK